MNTGRPLTQDEVTRCWPSLKKTAPCQHACPLNTDVPGYVMALARGNINKAMAILSESNPFPSLCGRICHHPCENECIRGVFDEPIAIRSLKRFITEKSAKTGWCRDIPATGRKNRRAAVIGAGPAGLSAAFYLAQQGYGVTVFESREVAGGMLTLGIPSFILPRELINAELSTVENMGVEIRTNITFGRDITIDSLFADGYGAIFLAVGAHRKLRLPVPGAELKGIHYALSVLDCANSGSPIQFQGTVIIIGGGNVAVDCARVAIRSGAREVNITCLESLDEMPAFPWEIDSAREEGVTISPSLGPQEMIGEDGRVEAVKFRSVRCIETDDEGRISHY